MVWPIKIRPVIDRLRYRQNRFLCANLNRLHELPILDGNHAPSHVGKAKKIPITVADFDEHADFVWHLVFKRVRMGGG